MQQLLLRVRLTTTLRQLRRERVHKREMREAEQYAARDAPLVEEMASCERRQLLLANRLTDTEKELAREVRAQRASIDTHPRHD